MFLDFIKINSRAYVDYQLIKAKFNSIRDPKLKSHDLFSILFLENLNSQKINNFASNLS